MKLHLTLKKRILRMALKTLLVSIDCVLCILKSYYAYEKRSPDVGESNDIKNGDIRRVNRIICKEKVIFIDFQKLIPRFLRSVFQSFWHPYPKTPLHGYFTCVKKVFWGLKSKICFHSPLRNVLENQKHIYIMVISLEMKKCTKENWKKAKLLPWVPFWNNRLHVLTF